MNCPILFHELVHKFQTLNLVSYWFRVSGLCPLSFNQRCLFLKLGFHFYHQLWIGCPNFLVYLLSKEQFEALQLKKYRVARLITCQLYLLNSVIALWKYFSYSLLRHFLFLLLIKLLILSKAPFLFSDPFLLKESFAFLPLLIFKFLSTYC